MSLGLQDPDPDPSVRGMDPDPDPDLDPSITCKKSKKNLDSYCFVTSFWLFIFENDVHVLSKSNKQKICNKLVFCWLLGKVSDENSRIRIRIQIRIRIHPKMSWTRNTAFLCCGTRMIYSGSKNDFLGPRLESGRDLPTFRKRIRKTFWRLVGS